jgi:hypothetical protein
MEETPDPANPIGSRRSPAEQHAWWMQMDAWVARLRNDHDHLWPTTPVIQSKVRRRPWPPCWRRHTGLVQFLDFLRQWQSAMLTAPPTEHTAKAMVDWHIVIEHTLAEEVQTIAKYCEHGHRGPGVPQAKKITDLTGKARGHWADPPAVPRQGEQPRRPHTGATSDEGLS